MRICQLVFEEHFHTIKSILNGATLTFGYLSHEFPYY